MKIESKIILSSIALAAFSWVADSVLDYFVFYDETFTEILLTNVPPHDLYIRIIIIVCFFVFGMVCARLIANQKKTEQQLDALLSFQEQLLDTIPIPVFHKDKEFIYTGCNKSFEEFMGLDKDDLIGKSVYDFAPADLAAIYHKQDVDLITHPGTQQYEFEVKSKKHDSNRQVIFYKATFEDLHGETGGLIGVILDITDRKEAEKKSENLITELQGAVNKVKLLSGFLPICASCKNIRDDDGYWNQIESYIMDHSEAEFSHGICPDCVKKLYPEFTEKSSD